MRSSQSLAHDPASHAGWSLCASALDGLGYDLAANLGEPELETLGPAHAALWAALELALLPEADAAAAGQRALPLPRELIDPLRDLALLKTVEAFPSKPGSAAELRRSLALEIGRAREAGLLAVPAGENLPAFPEAARALDEFLRELCSALAELRLTELAIWLGRPRVAERLGQLLSLILLGALRERGVAPSGADPLPRALETAASPSARAALFGLVAACERAARTSDAVAKLGSTPVGTEARVAESRPVPVGTNAGAGTALPEAVRKGDDVQFTVYRPRSIAPRVWSPMLAFAHLAEKRKDAPADAPDPLETVKKQAEVLLGAEIARYQPLSEDASQPIPFEGQLTFIPAAPGVEFDPPQASFRWVADVQRVEFKLRADASLAGSTARGQLTVLCGSVIVAELALSLRVSSGAEPVQKPELEPAGSARMYRKIFASYSHKDGEIVAQFRALAKALGDRYLIDVSDLRAGERWSAALEGLICEADVFQLFWSWNSIRSPYVRQEWEYALSLRRPNFLRPTYWEHPMPELPAEGLPPQSLAELHFQALNPAAASAEPAPEAPAGPPVPPAPAPEPTAPIVNPQPIARPAAPQPSPVLGNSATRPAASPAAAARHEAVPRARPRFLRWAAPASGMLAAAAALMLFLRTGAAPGGEPVVPPVSSPPIAAPPTATPEVPTAAHEAPRPQSGDEPVPPPPPPPPPPVAKPHTEPAHGRLGAGGMTKPQPLPAHGIGSGRRPDPTTAPDMVEEFRPLMARDRIDPLIAQQRASLQACLAVGSDEAARELQLHIRVLRSGKTEVQLPDGASPAVRVCIETRVSRWRFAASTEETLRVARLKPPAEGDAVRRVPRPDAVDFGF